jgi:hypothetical protein
MFIVLMTRRSGPDGNVWQAADSGMVVANAMTDLSSSVLRLPAAPEVTTQEDESAAELANETLLSE